MTLHLMGWWRRRRAVRQQLRERHGEAEAAQRDAERRWPAVRTAADEFAREVGEAMRRPPKPRPGDAR